MVIWYVSHVCPVCVEFPCSASAVEISSGFSGVLPTPQCVTVCVMEWQLVQGVHLLLS